MASILMIAYMIVTKGVYRLFIHTLPLSMHPLINEPRALSSLRITAVDLEWQSSHKAVHRGSVKVLGHEIGDVL
jgi:hypothetical protein